MTSRGWMLVAAQLAAVGVLVLVAPWWVTVALVAGIVLWPRRGVWARASTGKRS